MSEVDIVSSTGTSTLVNYAGTFNMFAGEISNNAYMGSSLISVINIMGGEFNLTIVLDSDIISDSRDGATDINISMKDEDGKERYTWSFKGSDLAASDKKIEDVDLTINIQRIEENEELSKLLGKSQTGPNKQSYLLIKFNHQGDLPAQASIRIYIGNLGYTKGDKIYLYHYNPETGKLETLPYSSNYVVNKNGYITICQTTL